MKRKFKKKIVKYRGALVILITLLLNVILSLCFKSSITIDVLNAFVAAGFFLGFLMSFYDIHKDEKEQLEEAFKNGAEELDKVGITVKWEEKDD